MARSILVPILGTALAFACATPSVAEDGACDACLGRPMAAGAERPLHIEIDSGLEFSRLALREAGGGVEIDPRTGQKRVDAKMIDLGGQSWQGRVRVTGEPLRPVRIELPTRVRLRSPQGGEAELTEFVTDLPAVAMLDADGRLEFAFGARLSSRGAAGGSFRGRIAIRVDYF